MTICRLICPSRWAPAKRPCCAWTGLFDVRQWRTPHQADADRPHPGSLRPHHLQARPARMPRLHGRRWTNQPEPTLIDQPRAGARSDDGLSDHLDDGRRGPARHRAPSFARSASRSPARPAPPTTKRTPGSSASRPISRSASISATTSRADSAAARPAAISRRRSSREFLKVALADKPAVPFRVPAGIKLIRIDPKSGMRAGPGAEQRDPRSVQARHRAAGHLLGGRLSRRPKAHAVDSGGGWPSAHRRTGAAMSARSLDCNPFERLFRRARRAALTIHRAVCTPACATGCNS